MINCPICHTPPSPSVSRPAGYVACRCGRLSVGRSASSDIWCWRFVLDLSVPTAYLERLGDFLTYRRPVSWGPTRVITTEAEAFVSDAIAWATASSVLDS